MLNLQGPGNHNSSFCISTPFAGYAVLLAIDTLSTSGPAITLAQTWGSMLGGLAFVRELKPLWSPGLDKVAQGNSTYSNTYHMTLHLLVTPPDSDNIWLI